MINPYIKYDMEKYAFEMKKLADLEDAVEFALTGKRVTVDPVVPEINSHDHEHKHYDHKKVEHNITSPYGRRKNPITYKMHEHKGIDIAGKEGSPVYAYDSGEVIAVSSDKISGNFVVIKHEEEYMISSYSHLSKQLVQVGQKIKQGDKIGLVGSTGRSTGPHLHFRLKYKNKDVNPALFIQDRRLVG